MMYNKEVIKINNKRILFSTVVGSHIWGMNHPKSDIDIMSIFIAPTTSFLLGKKIKNPVKLVENYDLRYMEIGHLVKLLKQCNINSILSVYSSIIIQDDYGILERLREIMNKNLAKTVFNSINGLAISGIKRFIEKADRESAKYKKKLSVIGRSLNFGINLLRSGNRVFPTFEKVVINSEEELLTLIEELSLAKTYSPLPDKPQHLGLFDEFIITLRKKELNGGLKPA